jgi:hypothetical protein
MVFTPTYGVSSDVRGLLLETEQAGRITVSGNGFAEAVVDVAGLEHR